MFSIGDKVLWESGAGSFYKTKSGVVVAVVPEGVDVRKVVRTLKRRHYRATGIRDMQGARDHESYLVECAGGVKPDAKKVLYWPRVGHLQTG